MTSIATQRGATLITALVMLVILTLLVVSAMRSSTTNMRITGNMQVQEEAVSAAQQGIEAVMSNDFTKNPQASAVPVTYGAATYTATVKKPVCTGTSQPLPSNDPSIAKISGCRGGNEYDPNNTSPSICVRQQWLLESHVDDPSTAASATVHQGTGLLVTMDTPC
jgi:type II secretory pathway pseudopilin PulG